MLLADNDACETDRRIEERFNRLLDEERAFVRDYRPWGLILFKRNIEAPEQVRSTVADIRTAAAGNACPASRRATTICPTMARTRRRSSKT